MQRKDFEQIIIGTFLVDNMAIHRGLSLLDRDHFSDPETKHVFNGILKALESGFDIDLLTVSQHCPAVETTTLVDWTMKVGSSAHLASHIEMLRRHYVVDILNKFQADATVENVSEVLERLESIISSAYRGSGEVSEALGAVAARMLEKSKKMAERGGEMVGDELWGVNELDKLLGGWEGGDVIAVAGRPKMGKSSGTNTISKYQILQGNPIWIASGEMPNMKSSYRLAAALAGIPTRELEKGTFLNDKDMVAQFEVAYEKMVHAKAYLYDGALSVGKMESEMKRHYYEHGVRIFQIDRMGLFQEIHEARDSNSARLKVAGALRSFANKMGDVAVVIYSQVNADAERTSHKRPEAHQIYGATAIQANCTKACIIYRPDGYSMSNFEAGPYEGTMAKGLAEVYTVLNNYGDLGSSLVKFNSLTQQFENYGQQSLQEDPTPQVRTGEKPSSDRDDLPF